MESYGIWPNRSSNNVAENIVRTKQEIIVLLAKRNLPDVLTNSTWTDLVASISSFDEAQKQAFVSLVANGNAKKAGEQLKRALHKNAGARSRASVEDMLADDSLDLTEIDAIL